MADGRRLIENGTPVIVCLWTAALKHRPPTQAVDYLHAAVVVGRSEAGVVLHDPKLPDGPTEISIQEFSEAWKLSDHLIACIRPRV